MNIRVMTWACVAVAVSGVLAADAVLVDSQEADLWRWLLERSGRKEHVERDGKGEVKWVGFYDEEKKKGDYYSGSLTLENGRVAKMTFNQANFTNDDLKRLAGFKHLKVLTAWHNGWDKQQADKSVYSGAGLVHFKGSGLESVNFGGSFFDDEGVKAALQVASLKELIVYHTRVTDAGLALLAGNDHIQKLQVGPQHSMKISEACLGPVSKMKAIEHLEINETILTWEGGLKHLAERKGQLRQFTCKQGLIASEDLEKLKAALPDTKIEYVEADEKQVAQMKRNAASIR